MSTRTTRLAVLALGVALAAPHLQADCVADGHLRAAEAVYVIYFESTWSAETHPSAYRQHAGVADALHRESGGGAWDGFFRAPGLI